jgi:rod shape-determining protein MreC
MTEFLRRNRVFLASGALLFLSLVLVSTSARNPDHRDPLARFLLDTLAPLQGGVTLLRGTVGEVWSSYVNLVGVQSENEQLLARVAELESEVVRMSELEQSHERLENLLRLGRRLEGRSYAARVIARDPLPWARTMTIDRGARDGIEKNMAVVSPEGVVGQVAEVSWLAARVLLLTDHNSGIDALVQRTRARGIAQGALEEGCHMKYLRRAEDIAMGDRVVTTGLDGIFPKGLLIGEAVEVARYSRDALHGAVVRPTVELDRVEEVLVLAPGTGLAAEAGASIEATGAIETMQATETIETTETVGATDAAGATLAVGAARAHGETEAAE